MEQYRVKWSIDEDADSPIEAIKKAYKILIENVANTWYWEVENIKTGERFFIDMEEENYLNDKTTV